MENIDHLIQRHIQQHLECHQPNLLEAVLELLKPNEAYKAADMTIQNASSTHQTAADQQVRLQSLQQVIQETVTCEVQHAVYYAITAYKKISKKILGMETTEV